MDQQPFQSVVPLLAGDLGQRSAETTKAGIPELVEFETKPTIALEQIRQALQEDVAPGVVVADAGYGVDRRLRHNLACDTAWP